MSGVLDDASCADMALRVDQLELRLQEANHRIANSLQLASALTANDARIVQDPDARVRLLSTQRHIEAIAAVHRLLSAGTSAQLIPLRDYLSRLMSGLQASVASESSVRILSLWCDQLDVAPEIAVCLGMILNELVGNACKYAYTPAEPGEVRARFTMTGDGFILTVEDDGAGIGEGSSRSGLGSRMVAIMARRIDAAFRFEPRLVGTRAVVVGSCRAFASGVHRGSPDPRAFPNLSVSSPDSVLYVEGVT